MTRRTWVLLAGCALGPLTACGALQQGELSNGGFTYGCVDQSDANCNGSFTSAGVPAAVAVGGRFSMTYAGKLGSTDPGPVRVVPSAPALIALEDTGLRVLGAGQVALLARTASGAVEDFVHVHAAAIDRFQVGGPGSVGGTTGLTLGLSTPTTLTATPVDGAGDKLGGALSYRWTSSAPGIVSLQSSTQPTNQATVTGLSAGTSTLTVEAGGTQTSIQVTVGGGQ